MTDADTNVGRGMIPCRKNCKCRDCQIERLENKLDTAQAVVDAARSYGLLVAYGNPTPLALAIAAHDQKKGKP